MTLQRNYFFFKYMIMVTFQKRNDRKTTNDFDIKTFQDTWIVMVTTWFLDEYWDKRDPLMKFRPTHFCETWWMLECSVTNTVQIFLPMDCSIPFLDENSVDICSRDIFMSVLNKETCGRCHRCKILNIVHVCMYA